MSEGDILLLQRNKDVITAEHMSKMKDQAIVCNIGHFDNEIQVAQLESWKGIKKVNIKYKLTNTISPMGTVLSY